jgi:hypothetical protein
MMSLEVAPALIVPILILMSGGSSVYDVLRDFAVPITALFWAITSWWRDQRRVLSITQEWSSSTSNRLTEVRETLTTFELEVVITNDSPKANIVIAGFRVVPPWNDPEIKTLPDPNEIVPPAKVYRVEYSFIDYGRDRSINHRTYQNGKLVLGDSIRGVFLARGTATLPLDLGSGQLDVIFEVTDTKGKRPYRKSMKMIPEVIDRLA